jgi:hypothetical protein
VTIRCYGEANVDDPCVATMLRRVAADLPFALPFTAGDVDHWIVLGKD